MSRSIDLRLPGAARSFRFGPATATDAVQEGPKISFKLLILFLIILYSSIVQVYPFLETFRPALLIGLLGIFIMIIEVASSRQPFRLMWPQGYMLLAMFGAVIMSSFSAIYARAAFDTTIELLKIVLIYILMENTITSQSRIRTVMMTLVIGGTIPAIGSIRFYLDGKLVEGSRAAWRGVFANPNELAYALVVLLPVAAALTIGARLWVRLALYGMMAAYLVSIYLTFSRGGLLALFFVIAMFALKQKSMMVRGLVVAALVLGLMVVGMFWNRKESFDNISADTTYNQRIATIMAGWRMFEANPMFGVGPGCSSVGYPLYVPPEMHCGCQEMLVIHNSFFQALSELGAIGFIPWIVFIGASLLHAWRLQKRGGEIRYAAALELGLWGFIICSLSGGFTYTWYSYLFAALVVAAKRISDTQHEAAAG